MKADCEGIRSAFMLKKRIISVLLVPLPMVRTRRMVSAKESLPRDWRMKSWPGLEEKSQCLSDISSMIELIFLFTFSGQLLMIKVCLLKLSEMDEWDRISCQFKGRLAW